MRTRRPGPATCGHSGGHHHPHLLGRLPEPRCQAGTAERLPGGAETQAGQGFPLYRRQPETPAGDERTDRTAKHRSHTHGIPDLPR